MNTRRPCCLLIVLRANFSVMLVPDLVTHTLCCTENTLGLNFFHLPHLYEGKLELWPALEAQHYRKMSFNLASA